MIVGIIADSHDRVEAIECAVDLFNREGVQHVFHAGDIVSPFAVLCFRPLQAGLHIVWGNNDGDKPLLTQRIGEMKADIYGSFMETRIDGRRIAMVHGVDEAIVDALAECGRYDLVIRGHTHRPVTNLKNETLTINPGASSGYLAQNRTIATVNLETMEAEIKILDT